MPVFTEQNDADLIRIHIERNAEHITRKCHQFIKAYTGETRYFSDAGGNTDHSANLPWRQLQREGFSHLTYASKDAVENVL